MENAFHNLVNAAGTLIWYFLDWTIGLFFQTMDMDATKLKGLALILWVIAVLTGLGVLAGLVIGIILFALGWFRRPIGVLGWRVAPFFFFGVPFVVGWVCALLLVKVGVNVK